MVLPILEPSKVTVMIKPVGALCNLDCTYCYYLPTKTVYDGHEHKMTLGTLESVFAGLLPHFGDQVTMAWQGGEPTLAGLDFFKAAMAFEEQYKKPGQTIQHALQTNGTLLDDNWCQFLRQHQFLVGLSIDGPPQFHNHYRPTNQGIGSIDRVLAGMKLLQKHAVDYNILCVLNDRNVGHPEEILHYLLKLGSRWVQFIPAIEWEKDPQNPEKNILAPYAPTPKAYGQFLCDVFDMWFEKYRTRLSVRLFDAVLNKLVLGQMPFCILDGSCHGQMTIEHDGSVFGCDHFIERRWQLAQIGDTQWSNPIDLDGAANVGLTIHGQGYQKEPTHAGQEITTENDLMQLDSANKQTVGDVSKRMVGQASRLSSAGTDELPGTAEPTTQTAISPHNPTTDDAPCTDTDWLSRTDAQRLGHFAARKQDLPAKCKSCQWKPYCHGGCPKHRPAGGEVPEPTILCEAYMMFYEHAMPGLRWLAQYIGQNQQPPPPGSASGFGSGVASGVASGVGGTPGTGGIAGVGNKVDHGGGHVAQRQSSAPATHRQRAPGRNEPCPCGSGMKFKHCHGQR